MTSVDEKGGFDFLASAVRECGENSSGFLALNDGNEYYVDATADGLIAYRPAGRYLIQLGGIYAADAEKEQLLTGFLAHATRLRRRVVAIQVPPADAALYAAHGFTVNQVGSSYSVSLADFTLRGSQFVKLRNKISRANRSGLVVAEREYADCADAVAHIDSAWLRGKGRHVKKVEFLVGECGGRAQGLRRLFVGHVDDEPVAYISYSPAYGLRPGWLHDLSRRTPGVAPGVMEAINLRAMETFRAEGCRWLHFGFTPFTGLAPESESPAASRVTAGFLRFLAEHGDAVYPARSQLAYKQKWAPDLVCPEYLAFHGRARFGAIWQILRTTNSV